MRHQVNHEIRVHRQDQRYYCSSIKSYIANALLKFIVRVFPSQYVICQQRHNHDE